MLSACFMFCVVCTHAWGHISAEHAVMDGQSAVIGIDSTALGVGCMFRRRTWSKELGKFSCQKSSANESLEHDLPTESVSSQSEQN